MARLEAGLGIHRPLPKIFRMVKKGKVDGSIFKGSTINTPSMLTVEDYLDALQWIDKIGGLEVAKGRVLVSGELQGGCLEDVSVGGTGDST